MTTADAEAIARIIDPESWRVMDGYLAETKRKYRGQNVGWPSDQFQDKGSIAKANAILSYLASRREAIANDDIADALERCDWSGAPIGNKAIIASAIERLRENVLFCEDAADHLALIDYISDKIGLPKDEELSREIFLAWLSASRREAQEPVAKDGLLPCPFCGGTAETDSQQAYLNISTGRPETAVAVYCTSCSAQHAICRGDVPDAELSDVTELWNRRTTSPSPAPAGEVERLREALQGALAEHDHKRKMQVMLTEPEWVEKARAARKGMGNE